MDYQHSVLSRYNKTLNVDAEDELVKSWGLISRPVHVPWALAFYFLLVYVGPIYMKNKKPFALKKTIMAYNTFQIVMNSYVLLLYYNLFGSQSLRWWENLCCPVSAAQNFKPLATLKYLEAIKWFYVNKLVDLLDTVLFILRKKNSQVTFLHVYHHGIMVVSTFISVMLLREELSMMFATLNSAVHVIMYSYYLLTAFGPAVQKYLWWKKYITSVQIVQFVIALSMLAIAKSKNCPVDPKFVALWAVNVTIFLVLFLRFYFQAYKTKKT